MKRTLFLFSILILIAEVSGADAEQFSIESAVRHGLSNNVDLAAARLTVDEVKARLLQAGRWSNPELETEFVPNINGRERSWRIGFNQKFPLTARLRLEKAVTQAEVKAAQAEVGEVERKLAFEIRSAAIHLAAIDAQLHLKVRQMESIQQLGEALEKSVKAGESSDLDSTLVDLERVQLESQRNQLIAQREELGRKLSLLMNFAGNPEVEFQEFSQLPENLEEHPLRLENRPDYLIVKAGLDGALQTIKLARANRWEDASFGLFGEMDRKEDNPVGLESEQMVGLRFAFPLPLWKQNKGRIAEARATAARLEKELEALTLKITNEVAGAAAQMKTALARAHSVRNELLPRAATIENRLTELHQQGMATFSDIARARERRLQFESAELQALQDFHLARASYFASRGNSGSSNPTEVREP